MSKFLSLVVSGAVSGAIYSLIASGLIVSYSASGIFNLAYGAIAFTTAFLYYELHTGLHWPIVPAAFVCILIFPPLLGVLLDRAIFRPLARTTDSAKIMATVGLLLALPALIRWTFERFVYDFHWHLPLGNNVFTPPGIGPSPRKLWHLPGQINIDSNQLIVFIVAAVGALGLWYLLRRTDLGLRMRALTDRPDLAALRGVDHRRVSLLTWILGMTLAGLAGVIAAPILGTLDPTTYTIVEFAAVAAVVVGGLRSIPLAYVGGLLLGVTQNLVAGYANFASSVPGFNASVPFVFLLVGLIVQRHDRRLRVVSVADDLPPPDYLNDLPKWRRAAPWAVAVAFLVLYIFVLGDSFWLSLVTRGLALALILLSFVILTGVGGMVSLAQAAFVTCAGLTAGVLLSYHVPFLVAMAGGAAAATLLGMVVALPALRLGGLPLALATLALAFVGDRVLFAWDPFRNTQQGWAISRPALDPFDLKDQRTMAVVLLVLVGLVTLIIRNLQRSSSGRAMVAVRAAEAAAATSGISPIATKLKVFALSAALAGVGGVLLASTAGNVTGVSNPAEVGLVWLATVVLFGIRRPGGAIIAGLASVASPQIIGTGFHWPSFIPSWLAWNGTKSVYVAPILFGLGAVQLARNPDGVISITAMQNHARRMKGRARRAARGGDGLPARAAAATGVVRSAPSLVVPEGADRHQRRELVPVDEDAALVLEAVHASYGDVNVLHGISLVLARGKITTMLGLNGSGKSTLCSAIAGLVPLSGGRILLGPDDISAVAAHARARRGLVLAPESRGIFPGLSVEDNLAMWLRSNADRDEAYKRFPVLRERAAVVAGELSGGEQQMLTIAPLLIAPPTVLIVDEPTLGLAPMVVTQLMTYFCELRNRGVAILLVEEKTRGVLEIADTVTLLRLGKLVWAGPPEHANDDLLATHLGVHRGGDGGVHAGAPGIGPSAGITGR